MKVKKAVILVAGFGTRFLPVTKTVPKEMLPIINKPAIQYIIDELGGAGITDLIFVVSKNKKAIEDYFDAHFELEELLRKNGKLELLKDVQRLTDKFNISFVRQTEPLGTGDAVLRAQTLVGDEPFIVVYPDDLFLGSKPFSQELINTYEETGNSVIALEEIPPEKAYLYGIIKTGAIDGDKVEVRGIVEKPKNEDAPSNLSMLGRLLLTPGIFPYLTQVKPAANGEFYLTDAVEMLAGTENVYGRICREAHFDTGNKIGYLKANLFEAYRDPAIRPELERFILELESENATV